MKKFICIFISACLMMLGVGGVFAADTGTYIINASDYFRIENFSPSLSDDGTLAVFKKYDADKIPSLVYNVRISSAGYYNIVCDGQFGGPSVSKAYIAVNGGEKIPAKNRVSGDFGYVYMKKGTDRIEISLPEHRSMDSYVYFTFKSITITKSTGREIYDINPTNALGVFDTEDEIGFELKFSENNVSEENIGYEVTNYFGDTVESGTFAVPANSIEHTVTLENEYSNGWYEINFDGTKASFAVLERTEQKFESPLGMDLFASYFGASDEELDGYANALKLMGITNIRDRIYWPGVENSKGTFDFSGVDKSIDKFSKAGFSIIGLFEGMPDWFEKSNGAYNLNDVYNTAETVARHYKGKLDAVEFQNEMDSKTTMPMDVYSAAYKAAASAMDSVGMKNLTSSLALYPEYSRQYENGINLMYQNGVMDYGYAHNVHSYYDYDMSKGDDFIIPLDGDYPDRRLNAADAYSGKEIYMTETGMAIYSIDGDKQFYRADARALVEGCVNNFAQGVDKQWYFTMSRRCENGYYEFGMINENDMPDPKLAAMSVMVKELKKAKFIGTIAGLPQNTYGALFNTGEGNTAVLWSDGKSEAVFHIDREVTVTDIMGNKTVIYPERNRVTVCTGSDPVYVDFGGAACYCTYYGYAEQAEKNVPLTAAKKVVVQQKYNEDGESVCENGYDLSGGSRTIDVEIYNFNDFSVTADLTAYATNGFAVSGAYGEITLSPMGKTSVKATVSANGASSGTSGDIVISGVVNGDEMSPSVARVSLKNGSGYASLPSDSEITINGDFENKVLTNETITFTLPGNVDSDTVKVESDGKALPFRLSGRKVSLPVNALKRGYYKVLVTAYTESGYAVYKAVTFCKNDL